MPNFLSDYKYFQDVYSIVYTDYNHTESVEVFKCSEDTSNDGEPWKGNFYWNPELLHIFHFSVYWFLFLVILLSNPVYKYHLRLILHNEWMRTQPAIWPLHTVSQLFSFQVTFISIQKQPPVSWLCPVQFGSNFRSSCFFVPIVFSAANSSRHHNILLPSCHPCALEISQVRNVLL